MTRPPQRIRRVIVLAATIWSQACVVHRPAPADMSTLTDARVRVSSADPFVLSEADSTSGTPMLCHATALDGRIRRVAGDTLVLTRVSRVAAAIEADGSRSVCPRREFVTFVRTPATEMRVRRTDAKRTTFLLVGIAAAFIGFAAFAASQIEYGFPAGNGSF
ncbi:MAG: hypothetical protein ACJ77T_05225 [Gemmatimonadaceae bacterium]